MRQRFSYVYSALILVGTIILGVDFARAWEFSMDGNFSSTYE
jgi:hypothetical protein